MKAVTVVASVLVALLTIGYANPQWLSQIWAVGPIKHQVVTLGSSWVIDESREMQDDEKTAKDGKYQLSSQFTWQGEIDFRNTLPPSQAMSDPFDSWWYEQAKTVCHNVVEEVRDRFVNTYPGELTVQFVRLEYDIEFSESFIPTSGIRRFALVGTQMVQFTDIAGPLGVDELILLVIIVGIIVISATVLLMQILKVGGPAVAWIFAIAIGIALVVGVIVWLGGGIDLGKKGIKITGKSRERYFSGEVA